MNIPVYTVDMVNNLDGNILKYVFPYLNINKPCNFLEIGSYEGSSANNIINILGTHSETKLYCLDVFADDYYPRFIRNTEAIKDKIVIVKDAAHNLVHHNLPCMDFIYVDANHEAKWAYMDCNAAFGILKNGGYMIMDDYYGCNVAHSHPWLYAKDGYEKFLLENITAINVFEMRHQIILQKK